MAQVQTDVPFSIAQDHFHRRTQFPLQTAAFDAALQKKFMRPRFSNYKCAGSTNIHDIIGAQSSSENAWAKSPLPSKIDAS
jgi:hypothetical protein